MKDHVESLSVKKKKKSCKTLKLKIQFKVKTYVFPKLSSGARLESLTGQSWVPGFWSFGQEKCSQMITKRGEGSQKLWAQDP